MGRGTNRKNEGVDYFCTSYQVPVGVFSASRCCLRPPASLARCTRAITSIQEWKRLNYVCPSEPPPHRATALVRLIMFHLSGCDWFGIACLTNEQALTTAVEVSKPLLQICNHRAFGSPSGGSLGGNQFVVEAFRRGCVIGYKPLIGFKEDA